MRKSDQIDKISAALSKFQGTVEGIRADKVNPFFKSRYSDLGSIWNELRQHLQENGLAVLQEAVTLPEGVGVTTCITHSSGQWIEMGPLVIPLGKRDAHTTGSSTTYARRYALSAALGLVSEEDDDGNLAKNAAPTKPVERISDRQLKNLLGLLGNCDPEYVAKVEESLQKNFGIREFKDLPVKYYDRLLQTTIGKAEDFRKKVDPLGMLEKED